MIDARRLVHEGRYWLECNGLDHLLDDPHTREEVIAAVNQHYPGGIPGLTIDLGGVPTDDELLEVRREQKRRHERARVVKRAAARRDLARQVELARLANRPLPEPDLIGDYKARRRARAARIAPLAEPRKV